MKDCSREGVALAGYIGGDGVEVREGEVVDFGGVLNGSGYEGVWGWERRLCFSLAFWAKSTMRSNLSFPMILLYDKSSPTGCRTASRSVRTHFLSQSIIH